jgi:hypothetical protein
MADEVFTGTGITPPKSLGWEPSPELQNLNKQVEAQHIQEYTPVVQAVAKAAAHTATPQDRVAVTDQLKNIKSADELRWGDLLGAKNFGDIYKAITGGSDQRVEAWDETGRKYYKVFNQRTSAATPNGEFRRYETVDGKVLSPEEEQAVGSITSLNEVPLTQRPFYAANNIGAKDVMVAQAANWNKLTKAASAAALGAGALRDIAVEDKDITKKLLPFSVNPAVRTLLAGANEIRTGNTQEIQNNAANLSRFLTGKATNKEFQDFKKTSGGFSAGVNYQEGVGATKANGERLTQDDVGEMTRSAMNAATSSNAVTARQSEMLAKAQLMAAEGKIQNFDLIQQYINNQAKKAAIINSIEENGGIGIAKPNLDFAQGDSFSLAHTKAELDEMYADLAEKFAQKVGEAQSKFGKSVPPIGFVEREIGSDKTISERKAAAKRSIESFQQENGFILEKLNQGTVSPALLQQPGSSKVSPSKQPEIPNARNPSVSQATNVATPVRRSLAEIRQGMAATR